MKNLKKLKRQSLKEVLGGNSASNCQGKFKYPAYYNGYSACCVAQTDYPCSQTVMCQLPIGMCD
ncbi:MULTISPECIES: bacteriocin-like protein [Chryseobacterium]|jgi:hypothetical protein|uniref:Bacteriocin n=1 Tax=Chryseobacterium rhizosphaerae TaxID=395937 RepID=A0AAE3Y9E7_9FLAO|nr:MULTISPECIES: hypothetical protein [Chryseobacterium]MBL3548560.1 hypothetical protein [Chryseobacterium sp. KMC2]MDC8102743.1 hypothetical protein [Chryseobacterium rhizosphaerae]MDR6526452.1 hypothetical protein [Chryseobacterium rhizosphaerae]MDR6546021.1 hypothetical protein [Chryseobacterium rhizosphaerae]SMC92581.1 hypothetical protein SAMN02787074_3818 [Chryseobacterium sp. YR221]